MTYWLRQFISSTNFALPYPEPRIIEMTDTDYMQQALREAANAFAIGEIPVGAVVVCQNRIIARAHNQTEKLTDVTAHAEMLAITAAAHHLGAKYLPECTLYVTLEPCLMCAGAIYWAQLGKIVYGASDEKRGYKRLVEASPYNILHPKTEIISGVLADECAQLMRNFFSNKR